MTNSRATQRQIGHDHAPQSPAPGDLAPLRSSEPVRAGPEQTKIVAHRGLLRHAPENTLANFRACLELRLGFEFDVQRTRDGQLVCIHDETADRTTNGTGTVSEMTLEQIRRLDAGKWFDPKFAGKRCRPSRRF